MAEKEQQGLLGVGYRFDLTADIMGNVRKSSKYLKADTICIRLLNEAVLSGNNQRYQWISDINRHRVILSMYNAVLSNKEKVHASYYFFTCFDIFTKWKRCE